MNIILVGPTCEFSTVSFETSRMEVFDDTHDPLSGAESFCDFFNRIDGRTSPRHLSFDVGALAKVFWDRDEFSQALHDVCENDVYVQASQYTMKIQCTSVEDYEAVRERFARPRVSHPVFIGIELRELALRFIHDQGVTSHQYRVEPYPGAVEIHFKEAEMAFLTKTKFAHTTPKDHEVKPLLDV